MGKAPMPRANSRISSVREHSTSGKSSTLSGRWTSGDAVTPDDTFPDEASPDKALVSGRGLVVGEQAVLDSVVAAVAASTIGGAPATDGSLTTGGASTTGRLSTPNQVSASNAVSPPNKAVTANGTVPRMVPSRDIEREWLNELADFVAAAEGREAASHELVLAGVDEVGRGALAGPVSVGIATITPQTSDSFPVGLRDSKMLTPTAREALIDPCDQWVHSWAVGSASPQEIDRFGIIAALRIAAARAVRILADRGVHIDGVLLDGQHNWWSPTGLLDSRGELYGDLYGGQTGAPEKESISEPAVLGSAMPETAASNPPVLGSTALDLTALEPSVLEPPDVPVRTVVKGDAQCAVVAAASVLAKVTRDSYMLDMAQRYPGYFFERNKGYASAQHKRALEELGPSDIHRLSWHLPGVQ